MTRTRYLNRLRQAQQHKRAFSQRRSASLIPSFLPCRCRSCLTPFTQQPSTDTKLRSDPSNRPIRFNYQSRNPYPILQGISPTLLLTHNEHPLLQTQHPYKSDVHNTRITSNQHHTTTMYPFQGSTPKILHRFPILPPNNEESTANPQVRCTDNPKAL